MNTIQMQKERIDWLRLYRTNNIGVRTFWDLINMFGTASRAIEHVPILAKKGGAVKFKIASVSHIDEEVKEVEKFGGQIIIAIDKDYPQSLKQLNDAPPALTIKGNIDLLNSKNVVAIVGARNASTNGCSFAKDIAANLSKAGFVIVSGLAKGIDRFAHEGAIEGGTIGVIAQGINNIYPQENARLYYKLYEQGLVLTEFAFNSPPSAQHFPQRNRIISGLSSAIVVVEAAIKSGTLITARFALDQGKDIFAVPGSPYDPRCSGTNKLIKDGAYLLESADDVISLLNSRTHYKSSIHEAKESKFTSSSLEDLTVTDKWRDKILSGLSYTPCFIEDIVSQTKVPLNILYIILIELELAGKIERLYGNKVVLIA